jgi:hypothetical protein
VKRGDLVTFTPEVWGTPLADRPLGVVTKVEKRSTANGICLVQVDAIFPGDDIPYSSNIKVFELLNESW